MARPREFDEQDVIAKATDLFRRRGYTATSVRDLGAELGLRQSSLYRTFGDKHALFVRALEHYRATESAQAGQRLGAPGPSLAVLREWLLWMVGHEAGRGCFVVNTAAELGAADPEVRAQTEAAFDDTRKTLAALLRRGVADGDLPAALAVDEAVELLFTTVLGLRVRERAGHDPRRLAAAIDFALAMLTRPSA
ncbi:TetR/AcrR family transcriptional regulator [Nonomuraea sp. NPDC004297]